jgi:hypothetical protein
MRDPGDNHLKAWAQEYEEGPFYFLQDSAQEKRLVAWSEESSQTKSAFYATLESFPETVEVLLKISVGKTPEEKTLWSRYLGEINLWQLIKVIQENEKYTFSDGMHQLCIRVPDSNRYLAFDDHGIFFIYEPTSNDVEIFKSLGFEDRYAEPIYAQPHFQRTNDDGEQLEMKFISALQLRSANSDLE